MIVLLEVKELVYRRAYVVCMHTRAHPPSTTEVEAKRFWTPGS